MEIRGLILGHSVVFGHEAQGPEQEYEDKGAGCTSIIPPDTVMMTINPHRNHHSRVSRAAV